MNWLNSHPVFGAVLLIVGFTAVIGAMVWAVSRAERDEKKDSDGWFV
jgi:hypothetical protein